MCLFAPHRLTERSQHEPDKNNNNKFEANFWTALQNKEENSEFYCESAAADEETVAFCIIPKIHQFNM
jgi:hypothetical protein